MKYIETDKIELKRIFDDSKRIIDDSFEKEVVAFLNTYDGIIHIGDDDNGEIIGVKNLDETMKKISEIISNEILPNAQEFITPIARLENDKWIIDVKIRKGSSLYYIKKYGRSSKGCYKRFGTTVRSMSEEQIEKAFIESLNLPKYSITEELSPRQDLTFRVFKIYLDSSGINYNEENFYKNNSLLTKEHKYNYQAYLLSDQCNISYKIAKWEGNTKRSTYLFKKEFGYCSILKAIDDLCSFVKSNVNQVSSYFDYGETSRRDEYLIDYNAFREGWINACLHNDYSTHLGPAVYLFNDHLEIFSYGSPLSVQSKENFLKGISKPINPELANVFMKVEKSEQSGKGINTIVKKYGKDVFEFGDDYLCIKLPYNRKVKNTYYFQETFEEIYNTTQEITQETTQEKILRLISENPYITRKMLAAKLLLKEDNVKYHLNKLKSEEKIRHCGATKNGYWEIIK